VGFTRYITIRSKRGETIDEMMANAASLLSTFEAQSSRVFTDVGRAIAHERLGRMRSLLKRFLDELTNRTDKGFLAISVARYLAADANRPSLFRQMEQMENVLRGGSVMDLQPSAFLRHFVEMLKEEIAGKR
jgi:hypothetical protein